MRKCRWLCVPLTPYLTRRAKVINSFVRVFYGPASDANTVCQLHVYRVWKGKAAEKASPRCRCSWPVKFYQDIRIHNKGRRPRHCPRRDLIYGDKVLNLTPSSRLSPSSTPRVLDSFRDHVKSRSLNALDFRSGQYCSRLRIFFHSTVNLYNL